MLINLGNTNIFKFKNYVIESDKNRYIINLREKNF